MWLFFCPSVSLFLEKDVYNWIEHSNPRMMLKNIDEDEKIKYLYTNSTGVLQNNTEYWFLTEDGLYEVLMQSRKPIARQFKKEVKKILLTISVFISASCTISNNLLLTSFATSESLNNIPILNNALFGINVNPLGGI